MSSAIPGVPIGPDVPAGGRRVAFDHIPRLRELLANGGWPGVTYAQVCVQNLAAARNREERPAHLRSIRGTTYYEIRGPKGIAEMALVGCGEPIPGAHPESGERLFFTDGEVSELTGLAVKDAIWFTPEPEPLETNPQAPAHFVEETPEPRQKRKYVRKQPWGHPEQRRKLAQARAGVKKNAHGRFVPKEKSDGARAVEPESQVGDGQGREGDARVQGGDAS